MSRDASVSFVWGDGEHTFRLGLGQLRELEDKRKVGAKALARRLLTGEDFVDDAREVIRLGLRGAGLTAEQAHGLLKHHYDPAPLAHENAVAALAIINAALTAPERDAPGKPEAAEIRTESLISAASTETSAPSGTGPAPSTP